jgi:hypothetical protein
MRQNAGATLKVSALLCQSRQLLGIIIFKTIPPLLCRIIAKYIYK